MFEAKGAKSRRQMLVDAVTECAYGELLPYPELGELFGLSARKDIQSAVNGAKRSIEVNCSKTLVAVPNEGYRVADPAEHYKIATVHQRKGRRQSAKALSKVRHVDVSGLSQEDRDKLINAQTLISTLQQFERRADLRYANRKRVESFIADQDRKNKRSDDQLSEMMSRLERLESKITA